MPPKGWAFIANGRAWRYPEFHMKRKTLALVMGSILLSHSAGAATFAEKCPDIATCAKVVGVLLGQKYLFDADVKGKVEATSNLELTQENAENLFTGMLNINGFSRVPSGVENTYQILRQRDARDQAIPTVSASQKETPQLPNNWDLYTLKYQATHPDSVENIARTSRSFMPANARVIPVEVSGTLLITDTAINLKKLYGIIKDLDRKPSAEMKKRWEEEAKARRAEMMMRKKSEEMHAAKPVPPQKAN